jgi:hypothetical protein
LPTGCETCPKAAASARGAAQKKWGPALLPSPTAPSKGFAGVRFVPLAPSRRKSLGPPRSLRTRSGDASVSTDCPVSRAASPNVGSWTALRPFHSLSSGSAVASRITGSGPKTFRLFTVPLRRFQSSPRLGFRRPSCEAPWPSFSFSPVPAFRFGPGKPVPLRSATNRPFAALLGTIVLRAALTVSCETVRPAAARRSSLPAPLAGFASKIL